ADADRRRGLPPRVPRGRLSRPRRLRARWLAGHRQAVGQPDGVLALDRRPRPHAGRGAGHPARPEARPAEARVRHPLRWAIPLAVVPLLVLLAYGFKFDPRTIPSPLVGKPAAAFELKTFDGTALSLASLRGQVVVVNFWASWCYPACYEEAPALERGWK